MRAVVRRLGSNAVGALSASSRTELPVSPAVHHDSATLATMRYSYRNTFPGVVRHPARVRAHVHLPAAIRCQHHEPVARLARNCFSIRNGRCHKANQSVHTLTHPFPGATLADRLPARPGARPAPAPPVIAAGDLSAHGGNIGRDDLTTYRAIVRNCSHNRNVTPSATGLASCMRNAPGIR